MRNCVKNCWRVRGNRLKPTTAPSDTATARATTAEVTVEEPVRAYVTRLARYTREHAELGVSPRGSIAAVRAAQGLAVLDSRSYVIPDDVQAAVPVVFPHRMQTSGAGADAAEIVADAIESVPVEE